MVMRNRKKEALEYLAQFAATGAFVWTLMWMLVAWG